MVAALPCTLTVTHACLKNHQSRGVQTATGMATSILLRHVILALSSGPALLHLPRLLGRLNRPVGQQPPASVHCPESMDTGVNTVLMTHPC